MGDTRTIPGPLVELRCGIVTDTQAGTQTQQKEARK